LKKVSDPIGDLWFLAAEFVRQGCAASSDNDDSVIPVGRGSGFIV
jgi:hypothetical protein